LTKSGARAATTSARSNASIRDLEEARKPLDLPDVAAIRAAIRRPYPAVLMSRLT
jgi:hypothetical protein